MQVEAAARVANAHDFISALPEAYGTKVGVLKLPRTWQLPLVTHSKEACQQTC